MNHILFTSLPDDRLLGLCIDREAEDQPEAGRIAVGSVVLNRVSWGQIHKGWGKIYGDTIQSVILAKNQFSWTLPQVGEDYLKAVEIATDFAAALQKSQWLQDNLRISQGLISGEIQKNTSALYYKVVGTPAAWAKGKIPILTIDKHEFFA